MTRFLAIILLVSCTGCGQADKDAGDKPTIRYAVDITLTVSEPPQRMLTAPAALAARESARIAARVSGIIDRVLINEGDLVRLGQSVADIDPERYRLSADISAAESQRARAIRDEAAAAQARRERAAREQPGLISEEELLQARARTAQADADVIAAESRLAKAQLDLRDAKVPSPIAGVIQSRNVVVGEAVQSGTPIATVIDRSTILLRFAVPAASAADVTTGATVHFKVAGEAIERSAAVILVAGSADERTRQVEVIARVADADAAAVRPGTFAEARIDLPPGTPRILIPDLAVQPSEKGYLVWTVVGSGASAKAVQRSVTVGSRTRDGRIEILSGLAVGEPVVVRGGEALRADALLDIGPSTAEPAKR